MELYIYVMGLEPVALPVRVEGRIAKLIDSIPRLGGAQRPTRCPTNLANRRGQLGNGEERERRGGLETEVAIIAGRSMRRAVGLVGVAIAR